MADINPIGARATAEAPNTSRGRPEVTKLASLKQLAQQHLGEIDDMTRKERLEEEKRKAELDDEAKRKERRQRKQQPTAQEESHGRKGRMRTAQDVLDRLRWDSSLRVDEHRVGYIDRFGGIQELAVSAWIRESTDEDWIPQHRIRYFKRITSVDAAAKPEKMEDRVVWHRDQRIDKIFGHR